MSTQTTTATSVITVCLPLPLPLLFTTVEIDRLRIRPAILCHTGIGEELAPKSVMPPNLKKADYGIFVRDRCTDEIVDCYLSRGAISNSAAMAGTPTISTTIMFHPHSDKDRQIKALAACKDRIKGRLEAACNLASAQAHGPDGAWTSKLAWKWCCPVVMKRFDTNTTRATDVIEIPICRGDCLVECTVVLL
jgi:hypothetical protein